MTAPAEPLEAARRALAASEWAVAERSFRDALAARESPEALEGLGWALWWQDRAAESFEVRERAYRALAAAGDARAAARVAIALAIDIYDHQGPAVMNGWLQRARRHLEGVETAPEHGWLALWEGHYARWVDGDLEAARRAAGRVMEIGRRFGIADLEMLGLALEGATLVSEGRVDEGMRRLDEATAAALAGEILDLGAASQACCLLMHACEKVRDLDRAAQWVERAEAFSRRWRVRPLLAICRVQHASLQIARGDWSAAEAQLDAVAREGDAAPGPARSEALLHLGELRRRQGRWDEAGRLLAEVESFAMALLNRAQMALDEGDHRSAVHLLARCLRRATSDQWTLRATALRSLARAHAALGESEAATVQLEALRELAAQVRTDYVRATERLAESGLRAAAGEAEEARHACEDAVDLFERCRAPYEAARARLELAALLRAHGHGAPARREAELARDAFRRLGAARDAEAAEGAIAAASAGAAGESAEGGDEPLPGEGPRLTKREREVLALVAEGLADKEIAARLALSGHTVHRHVSNVLVKLGVPSRTAAVALAMRRRLL